MSLLTKNMKNKKSDAVANKNMKKQNEIKHRGNFNLIRSGGPPPPRCAEGSPGSSVELHPNLRLDLAFWLAGDGA